MSRESAKPKDRRDLRDHGGRAKAAIISFSGGGWLLLWHPQRPAASSIAAVAWQGIQRPLGQGRAKLAAMLAGERAGGKGRKATSKHLTSPHRVYLRPNGRVARMTPRARLWPCYRREDERLPMLVMSDAFTVSPFRACSSKVGLWEFKHF